MQNMQQMNIIWDNTAPIDGKLVSVLKVLGPLSADKHSFTRPSLEESQRASCSVISMIVSHRSTQACFRRALPIKVFMVLGLIVTS